jgi:hypothetical protein
MIDEKKILDGLVKYKETAKLICDAVNLKNQSIPAQKESNLHTN